MKKNSLITYVLLSAAATFGCGGGRRGVGGGPGGPGLGGSAGGVIGDSLSPVSVKFTERNPASLALAGDLNGRFDFGGQIAVTSYAITVSCATSQGSTTYTLKGGRMLVRSDETACASALTNVVLTDQQGISVDFGSNDLDPTSPAVKTMLATDGVQYPNLRLDLTGKSSPDGQTVQYTYTLRDSTQGPNTTGTTQGDQGTHTSVQFAGVPLPDVSPNMVLAFASLSGAGGSFVASIQAASSTPCGPSADYAVELYAQTGTTTTELAAHDPSPLSHTSGDQHPLMTDNDDVISDCRGLTTNLYLKLSCTSHIGTTAGLTSFKLVSLESQIPSSLYLPPGVAASHQCANATIPADMTLLRDSVLTTETGTFLPPAH